MADSPPRARTVILTDATVVPFNAALAAYDGSAATPTPTPAPAFITQPSLSPQYVIAGNPITIMPGVVTGATSITRTALLNDTALQIMNNTVTSQAAGTVTYQESATGPGGTILSTLRTATVAAAGPTLSVVRFAFAGIASAEGVGATAVFTLERTVTTSSISVLLQFDAGTTSAIDFDGGVYPGDKSIEFSSGQSQVTFAIPIADDAEQEAAETFSYTIQAGYNYTIGAPSSSIATVADNDTPVDPLPAMTTSAAFYKGSASTISLLSVPTDATITGIYPGMTLDSSARTLTGTPTSLSGLLTYTKANGERRDTILFSPKLGQRKMRVGMNLAGIAYYYDQNVFLDYFKSAEWLTRPATVDSNDMPLTLALDGNGAPGASLIFTVKAGKHRIVAPGADLDIQGWTKEDGDWVKALETGQTIVNFTAIRTPPLKMGFVRDEDTNRYKSGQVFKQTFLAEMAKFAWVRFMNVHGGNTPEPTTTPVDFLSYQKGQSDSGGWPLSIVARLCREAQTNCYLNVHAKITTEQYVSDILPTLQSLIADGIEVYNEYSNEAGWNDIFAQFNYLRQQARDAGYGTVGNPNYTGDPDYWAGIWWVGKRVAEMAKVARGTGIRWLIGTQTVQADYLSTILFKGANTVAGRLDSDIWGWIASGYVGGTLTQDPGGTQGPVQDEWVRTSNYDAGIDNLLNYSGAGTNDSSVRLRQYYRSNKAIANAHGWYMVVYEGNIHGNSIPNARNTYADYRPYLFALPKQPSMSGFSYTLLETSEEEGVYGYSIYDWDSQPTGSEFGVFGVYGLPGYLGFTQFAAETDDSGGSVVLPPPDPTPVSNLQFRITAIGVGSRPEPISAGDVLPSLASFLPRNADGSFMSTSGWSASGDQIGAGEGVSNLLDSDTGTVWTGKDDQTNVFYFNTESPNTARPFDWYLQDRSANPERGIGNFIIEYGYDGVTWTQGFRTVSPYPLKSDGSPRTPGENYDPNNAIYNPDAYGGSYANHTFIAQMTYAP